MKEMAGGETGRKVVAEQSRGFVVPTGSILKAFGSRLNGHRSSPGLNLLHQFGHAWIGENPRFQKCWDICVSPPSNKLCEILISYDKGGV